MLIGRTSKANAYSNSRDRNTRRLDFGRKKKEKKRGVLERGGISVREKELILQRAEGRSRDSYSSLRLMPRHAVCRRPSYCSSGPDAMGIEKLHNFVERI